jgi:protein-L-isoaspartate O-methyltransferase
MKTTIEETTPTEPTTADHYGMTATYSPEDNKLRLRADRRLESETYAAAKAAGFRWAPRQELFVAPAWTVSREDFLLGLGCEIGDEDTSLVDRAEQRAERFDGYRENRKRDAHQAREGVEAISAGIPFGQPILVGHHSERHARRDAQRIENGMRKAVKMWECSEYWVNRAEGARRHAKYVERPDVRARRIKKLAAAERKHTRKIERARKLLKTYNDPDACGLKLRNGYPVGNALLQTYESGLSFEQQHAFDKGEIDINQALTYAVDNLNRQVEWSQRWLDHYQNRLTYERAMLGEQGRLDLLEKPKRPKLPPILNYRAPGDEIRTIQTRNKWRAGELKTLIQIDITKAQLATVDADYKGTNLSPDGSHRIREAMLSAWKAREFGYTGPPPVSMSLFAVFLTDSKTHPRPAEPAKEKPGFDLTLETEKDKQAREAIQATQAKQAREAKELAARQAATLAGDSSGVGQGQLFAADSDLFSGAAEEDTFAAMKNSLAAGPVQIVAVDQFFPTPAELVSEMIEAAEIEPGQHVLEPSAGDGAIFRAIPADTQRTAVEINRTLGDTLKASMSDFDVLHYADFLECNGNLGKFDRVIMNPPFKHGADILHIRHAQTFLKPGGRLVALCAAGPRQREALKPIAEESGGEWRDLPAGSFKTQGTGVNVAMVIIEAPLESA